MLNDFTATLTRKSRFESNTLVKLYEVEMHNLMFSLVGCLGVLLIIYDIVKWRIQLKVFCILPVIWWHTVQHKYSLYFYGVLVFVELGLLPSSLTRSSGVFVGFLCALWVYRTSHEHAVGWFGYIRMPHDVNECVIMCLYGALRLYKWWSVQTHDVWWCFSRNVLDVVNLWHGRTVCIVFISLRLAFACYW